MKGWEPHLCGGSPTILLATSTITLGYYASRDYLYLPNYFDPRISAPQNVLFSYGSLSIDNFRSDLVSTC